MKVIDLLNKIAKGEEVPNFMIEEQKYFIGDDGYLKTDFGDDVEWYIFKNWLNEEAKIIEEEKDIEELRLDAQITLDWNLAQIENKFNELVREVNKLKNK